jgi:hypothetical protein
MINPITPQEAIMERIESIPDFVIKAFNEMIVENLEGKYSTVLQKDVVKRIITLSPERLTSGDIFKKHLLDVEDAFRKAGWTVVYDQPAYDEDYEPSFRFSFKG